VAAGVMPGGHSATATPGTAFGRLLPGRQREHRDERLLEGLVDDPCCRCVPRQRRGDDAGPAADVVIVLLELNAPMVSSTNVMVRTKNTATTAPDTRIEAISM